MTASEQSGIDILCDAAGSDMLLSSLFSLASPDQRGQLPQHLEQEQKQQQQQQLQQLQRPSLPLAQPQALRSQSSKHATKRKLSNASPSSPSHVCHICKRMYERADHLTRHLRSHENARPYQCSRCPKRFNRADLLTRHEATHDRDGVAKGPFIRRSDRAAEACLNCAASKAKCEDEKPCNRCRGKGLTCQMPPKRGHLYRTSNTDAPIPPSEAPAEASLLGADNQGFVQVRADVSYPLGQPPPKTQHQSIQRTPGIEGAPFSWGSMPAPPTAAHGLADHLIEFNPSYSPFKDGEFSCHMDLDGLTLEDGSLPTPLELEAFHDSPLNRLEISSIARDRLFAIVLNKEGPRITSFPSTRVLSSLLQAHFAPGGPKCDALIHLASFQPDSTDGANCELLCALIASGATNHPTPSVWQFGLGLDEVTHQIVSNLVEKSTSVPGLQTLQAYMVHLEIGQWCGFKRKMDVAESFVQPLLTVLRRSGKLSIPPDSTAPMPCLTDSPDVLDAKWKHFIVRESYKRLIIRLFSHDVQASIWLCKSPLMSFDDLDFSLPASRDLWMAATADEWRDVLLAKKSHPDSQAIPKLRDMMHMHRRREFVDSDDRIDPALCYTAMLHGYWGPISSYRESVNFYLEGLVQPRPMPPFLEDLYEEIFQTLRRVADSLERYLPGNPKLALLAELLMMLLHVSPDDLKRAAGQNGDAEATRTMLALRKTWSTGPRERSDRAAWSAVMGFAAARKLNRFLRGFEAAAVYLASLTLWVYGATSYEAPKPEGQDMREHLAKYVAQDGPRKGTLGEFADVSQTLQEEVNSVGREPVSTSEMALKAGVYILRDGAAIRGEVQHPFSESLANHLEAPEHVKSADDFVL